MIIPKEDSLFEQLCSEDIPAHLRMRIDQLLQSYPALLLSQFNRFSTSILLNFGCRFLTIAWAKLSRPSHTMRDPLHFSEPIGECGMKSTKLRTAHAWASNSTPILLALIFCSYLTKIFFIHLRHPAEQINENFSWRITAGSYVLGTEQML